MLRRPVSYLQRKGEFCLLASVPVSYIFALQLYEGGHASMGDTIAVFDSRP